MTVETVSLIDPLTLVGRAEPALGQRSCASEDQGEHGADENLRGHRNPPFHGVIPQRNGLKRGHESTPPYTQEEPCTV
jgi:hypothetical protein